MLIARKVALRVNGVCAINARVRPDPKGPQLVITDPGFEEFAVDESFTLELLELVHPHKIAKWRLEECQASDIDWAATERSGPGRGGEPNSNRLNSTFRTALARLQYQTQAIFSPTSHRPPLPEAPSDRPRLGF